MRLTWDSAASGNVFTEVTGTVTFTDDNVRGVYIDWGDGTNPAGTFTNNKNYANYQWVTTTEPQAEFVVSHTYTATGTFNPLIQTVNSEGYFSNYTSVPATNTEVSPYSMVNRFFLTCTTDSTTTLELDSGDTDDVVVGMLVSGSNIAPNTFVSSITDTDTLVLDTAATGSTADLTIYFYGNQPFVSYDGTATGVMRVENKTVKSGIDNSIFEREGPKDLKLMIPPLCTDAQLTTIDNVTIEIEAEVATSMISTTDNTVVGGSGKSVQTISTALTGLAGSPTGMTDVAITGGQISRVLKVTYKNPKYTTDATDYDSNAAYQNLKIFLVVQSDDTNYYPISYVSAGAPIKRYDDPLRNITLDFSQSRAKASNVSLDSYRYDNGKVWFNPAYQWATTGTSTIFADETKQTASDKSISYTYEGVRPDGLNGQATLATDGTVGSDISALAFDPSTTLAFWDFEGGGGSKDQKYRIDQFVVDEFGRFTDQYHLTRVSADPNTTATGGTSNVSTLVDNKPYVFRITPTLRSTMSLATSGSATKIDLAADTTASGNFTADYTNKAFDNGSSNMVSLSGMNTQTFNNFAGSEMDQQDEYILLLFPEKTNKIFFNLNNYANSLITTNLSGASFTTPWKINGVSYLKITESGTRKQDTQWQPLDFNDTTKVSMEYRDTSNDKYVSQSNSLSQSGFVTFDMPLDWYNTTLTNLCGGQFNETFDGSGNPPASSGANDIVVSGGITDLGSGSNGFGGVLQLGSVSEPLSGSQVTGGILDESVFGDYNQIGSFKYIALCTDTGSVAANAINKPYWVASGTSNGADIGLKYLYFTYGEDSTNYTPSNLDGKTNTGWILRRVNVYDVFNGVSKVEEGDAASATKLIPVDTQQAAFPNTYIVADTSAGVGEALTDAWASTALYAVKISLSGAANGTPPYNTDAKTSTLFPEIWNVFDGNRGYEDIIKQVDDTAYNLNALPISSDISVTRAGAYYSTITRKGKVFIARTGDTIQNISFSSVALGDSSTFDTYSAPSSLYGQLRKIRGLHANNVRVYWDEVQKDGTYTRYWGIITNVAESHGTGGPRSVVSYTFNMMIEEIALIDVNGNLMTDIFPLGGIGDEKDFT